MVITIDREHRAYFDHPELAEGLLHRAKLVASKGVFLGSPLLPTSRYLNGYNSLLVMKYVGLKPHQTVLEIGCGALRSGYWVIKYLDKQSYFGIEPNAKMLNAGINTILTHEEIFKTPEFSTSDDFPFDGFGMQFDYVLACSIWSHAAKCQISIMLDQFKHNTPLHSKFLTSYIPAPTPELDYLGNEWVGRSHKSNVKGVVAHSLDWILETCNKRGLTVETMPDRFSFGNQEWLCIKRMM